VRDRGIYRLLLVVCPMDEAGGRIPRTGACRKRLTLIID
jgi:hypothetical protein